MGEGRGAPADRVGAAARAERTHAPRATTVGAGFTPSSCPRRTAAPSGAGERGRAHKMRRGARRRPPRQSKQSLSVFPPQDQLARPLLSPPPRAPEKNSVPEL